MGGVLAANTVGRSLSLTIPGAPVAKGRPRLSTIGGQARAFTPAKTRRYEDLIRLEGGRAMEGRALLAGPLAVRIVAHLAMPKSLSKKKQADALAGILRPTTRPDVDNYAKVIDGLNGVAWTDDAQIVTLTVSKHYSDRPRLELHATEIGGQG